MDESKSTGERLLTGYFDRFTVEHLHRYAIACQLAHGKDVLDIASGEGYGSNLLATVANTVIGVDIDSIAVSHAKNKYSKKNLDYLTGSASSIPLEPDSVDLVVSFETLEHHDQHEAMYSEIKRVLRHDGVLIISTPDKHFFSDLTGHRNAYHIKELYFDQFLELNSRHFSNVAMHSQKTVLGSLCLPHKAENGFSVHRGDPNQLTNHVSFEEPTYHICLASDFPTPGLGPSFFDGQQILNEMDIKIGDQDEQIKRLASQIDAQHKVNIDLKKSRSYRLGSILLHPIKWLVKQ